MEEGTQIDRRIDISKILMSKGCIDKLGEQQLMEDITAEVLINISLLDEIIEEMTKKGLIKNG